MQTLNLIQGSNEWHAHRRAHFNASDAPAMLAVSPYKTRGQLLEELKTGIGQEFDAATERRFADGHRFEALARPLAEKIIGEELSPIVGSEGKYSASFDGITFDESINFEHKSLNAELRRIFDSGEPLPELYTIQMEQQHLVSGAERTLFMASAWDADGNLIEERHCWYEPNMALRKRIIDGWEQFEKDMADYVPPVIEEKATADSIMELPALSVQATGMVTHSNLPQFKAAAEQYIAAINTELVTDQHFADAEATVKFCKSTEEKLEVTKAAILAQTASIDEVIRTVDHIQAQLRDKRLMLDKLVKSEKEARKVALVRDAGDKYAAHVTALKSEIGGVQFLSLLPRQDFGAAIKGLKSMQSMHDALDTALANSKIEADATAKDIRDKLAWCKEHAAGHSALFPDLQQIIIKPFEDFTLTITSRIDKYKADEAAKAEAAIKRIEAEAKAKAEREAAEKLAAEEARIRAEERAKAEAESVIKTKAEAAARVKMEVAASAAPSAPASISAISNDEETQNPAPIVARPTRMQMVTAIAERYRVPVTIADEWLRAAFSA